jgi:hypothetical protein
MVGFGYAEQVADHSERQRMRQGVDEVELGTRLQRLVHESLGAPLDVLRRGAHHSRPEGVPQHPAQPGVVGRIHENQQMPLVGEATGKCSAARPRPLGRRTAGRSIPGCRGRRRIAEPLVPENRVAVPVPGQDPEPRGTPEDGLALPKPPIERIGIVPELGISRVKPEQSRGSAARRCRTHVPPALTSRPSVFLISYFRSANFCDK